MSDKRIAKEQVVNEIKEKFQRAEAVVLVDYRGLNVAEVTELRKRSGSRGRLQGL